MYVCMYVCMYVSMYLCIYVSMYVSMYACMHVYMYIFPYIDIYCVFLLFFTVKVKRRKLQRNNPLHYTDLTPEKAASTPQSKRKRARHATPVKQGDKLDKLDKVDIKSKVEGKRVTLIDSPQVATITTSQQPHTSSETENKPSKPLKVSILFFFLTL